MCAVAANAQPTHVDISDTNFHFTSLISDSLASGPNNIWFPSGTGSTVCIFDGLAHAHAGHTGDILFLSNGSLQNFWTRLSVAPTSGWVLASNGFVPGWVDPATGITGFVKTHPTITDISNVIQPSDTNATGLTLRAPIGGNATPQLIWTRDDGGASHTVLGANGIVAQIAGGTGYGSYTTGNLLYASATNTLSKLAIGTTGQVLTVVSGVPAWADAAGGGRSVHIMGNLEVDSFSTLTGGMSSSSGYFTQDVTIDGTLSTAGITNLGTLSTHGNIIQVTSGTATFLNTTVNTFHATQDAAFDQSVTLPVFITDTNYTMSGHEYLMSVDNSGGDITITLPDLVASTGKVFVVTQNASNLVHVVCAGSDTYVTGVATRDVDSKIRPLQLWNNGFNWYYIEY